MAQEPAVVLRLSAETARHLHDALYMLGEHLAAGVPVVPMGTDVDERLARVMYAINGQLGRGNPYNLPSPSTDAIL